MDTNPSNARELVALRTALNGELTMAEIRAVNWATVTKAAGQAITRGWTGTELAAWAIGDLGEHTENAGAVIVTRIRDMGHIDPPRDSTPTPPPVAQVLAEQHTRHTPAANPGQWLKRIRGESA